LDGTLEAPPVVLTQSRWKLAVIVAVCLLATPILFEFMAAPDATDVRLVRGLLGFTGCCAGVFLGLAKLARPDRLEIAPDGLRLASLTAHPFEIAWRDIDGIRTWKLRRTTSVVLDLTTEGKESVRTSAAVRRMTGADISLPGGLPIRTDELLALLTAAKARWEQAAPARAEPHPQERGGQDLSTMWRTGGGATPAG